MFGSTSKSLSQSLDAAAGGNGKMSEGVALDRVVDTQAGQERLPVRSQAPVKDYPVLESVDGDGLVLIGKNTRLVGEISNCSRVEIQGALEGTVVAETVVVREGGTIKGQMRTTNADVQGVVDGEVSVAGLLDVKSTGQVTGDITYGQFSVQVGGVVAGNFSGRTSEDLGQSPPVTEI